MKPGFGVSAREAYEAVDLAELSKLKDKTDFRLTEFVKTGNIKYCYNALEKGVRRLYSEIDAMITQMMQLGASNSILSGSGSTIIGFCPDRQVAEKLSNFYSKRGYWNCITKSKKRSTL